ncbi:MAG: hypothetical protein J6B00_00315 [Alphaproteobacteria bacterium]|nr:hypothetical protein [Alphaproteobacteria bacterium]MBO5284299.1 hypothetical protein [Alphaproteobacteria bacterium]
MKKLGLLTLFLCCVLSMTAKASETLNWCGTYFEDNGRGFIRLAREDLNSGSSSCTMSEYNEKVANTGYTAIALDFTKSRSALSNWRKFDKHLIEVRGKYRDGSITSTRLVRDMGV